MNKVTIVVPIYKDWESLQLCIESLKEYVSKKHTILLINDMGPEWDYLEDNILLLIQDHPHFIYYRNESNLGFVRTCNRAVLELDQTSNDILLLNSDTKVTKGFLEEMMKVLCAEENHGVVCPRSNNATFLSVPYKNNSGRKVTPEESYDIYTQIKDLLPQYSLIPTGVGFAFLIKRKLISNFGLFDEIFGPGYNEENDFCMRIWKNGYSTLAANYAYVYHNEGKSFGQSKERLEIVNSSILLRRYPDYWKRVKLYEKLYKNPIDYFGDLISARLYNKKRIVYSILDINPKDKVKLKKSFVVYNKLISKYSFKYDFYLLISAKHKKYTQEYNNVIVKNNDPKTFHLALAVGSINTEEHLVKLNKIALQYAIIDLGISEQKADENLVNLINKYKIIIKQDENEKFNFEHIEMLLESFQQNDLKESLESRWEQINELEENILVKKNFFGVLSKVGQEIKLFLYKYCVWVFLLKKKIGL